MTIPVILKLRVTILVEIVLPTKPLNRIYNPEDKTYKQEGLIALCKIGRASCRERV